MSGGKVQEFYEEIKFIAAEIGVRDIPARFIEVAKKKDEEKLNELFEAFKEENSDLWERMENLYSEYKAEGSPTIFDVGDHLYDPTEINPINLCFVFLFSNDVMDDCDTFVEYGVLQQYLNDYNYQEIAKYLEKDMLYTFEDLIKAVSETE